jgi:hypothetical protein
VFVALVIQQTMRMPHIFIGGLPASTMFPTLSHKRQDFRKINLLKVKCVFWFYVQILSETFLILITKGDVIKNIYWSPRTAPFILVRF